MKGRISKLTLALLASTALSTGFASNLMQVYQQAAQNDSTYKSAESTYLSTKQAMPLAYANLLPTIDATAGYNVANSAGSTDYHVYKSWGATLDQTIFNWSAFAGISGAKATVRGALATYQAAKQTLIQNTISAYLTVVQDAATVQYDEAYSKQLHEFLKQQQQKYKVGIIPITDVYQAQSNYDTQYATTIKDKNTLDSDIEALRIITGKSYSSIKGVGASLPLHTPNPNNMETWVKTALSQNLTIMAARAQVDVDKATVSGDRGAHLPSIDLKGSYLQTTRRHSIDNKGNPNASSIGLALDLPIFSGGQMFAQTRKDAYTLQADQQALDSAIRSTVASTRTNYLGVMAAISGVQAAKQAYVSADKTLKATQAGYQVGTNTITDVLTAMSARVQAQEGIVTNQVAYLNAIIALKLEAGTLNDRDVKAIAKLLNKNVTLPNTLSRKSYGGFTQTTTAKAAMTDAQKAAKASSTKAMTSTATTKNAISHIHSTSTASKKTSSTPYSIQLFVSNSQTRANSFIKNYLSDSSQAFVSQHVTNGQTYYAVMYGHYASHADAATAITHLSNAVQRMKPFVKKV